MQPKVIITCAVTGAGDTVGKHPAIPVTPEQIANSALEAASAGATVVHCHVREPSTGKGSRKVAYYREVMERIRDKNKEVIINLTAGMGGDVEIGSGAKPLDFGPGTDLRRSGGTAGACQGTAPGTLHPGLRHAELRRRQQHRGADTGPAARTGQAHHVLWREARDGNLRQRQSLVRQAALRRRPDPGPAAVPALPRHSLGRALRHARPWPTRRRSSRPDAVWAAFGIGRNEFPAVAQAVLLGGHVRVGLEDNLWLEKGVYASNGTLVEKAVKIIEMLGTKVASPDEGRAILKLAPRKK